MEVDVISGGLSVGSDSFRCLSWGPSCSFGGLSEGSGQDDEPSGDLDDSKGSLDEKSTSTYKGEGKM